VSECEEVAVPGVASRQGESAVQDDLLQDILDAVVELAS
jgi:hypothetical protein